MIGQKIAHYEITASLGRGGMGEVYLGVDTRLDRRVAVKVLPDVFAADPERLARFEREAKVLAQLNHPNVAGIHGLEQQDGHHYLILEYVEGRSLAEVLATGPLPPDETIEIAAKIAAGVAAAHDAGVVHRDLKPGNVMLRADGEVKLLDFGLARSSETSTASGDADTVMSPATQSPTIAGAILGTAAYMSPEQAKGRHVDRRTDVWSFGVVVYEMLTGASPFLADSTAESIGAVLHAEVDFGALGPKVPPHVRRVLERCLDRDPDRRYRDVADAAYDLQHPPAAAEVVAAPSAGRRWGPVVVLQSLILAALVAWLVIGRGPAPTESTEFPKVFTIDGVDLPIDAFHGPSITPDGSRILLRLRDDDGQTRLYQRAMNSTDLQAIQNSMNGWLPFVAPDSRRFGFYSMGRLYTGSFESSSARPLAEVVQGFSGAAWMPDGTIWFAGTSRPELYRLSDQGGDVEVVPLPGYDTSDVVATPSRIVGRNALLLTVRRGAGSFQVTVVDLDDLSSTVIAEDGFAPIYATTGHVLYQSGSDGPLMARAFDPRSLEPSGAPVAVAQDLTSRISFQERAYALSDDGTLIYTPGEWFRDETELFWLDADGSETLIKRFERTIDMPRISHDGTRIAFRTPAPDCDVWVHDIERGTTTKITRRGDNHGSLWTRDDRSLAVARRVDDGWQLATISADGSGREEVLARTSDEPLGFLVSIDTERGIGLVETQKVGAGWDILSIDLATGERTPLFDSRWDERSGALSPDGSLIAYTSSESGTEHVYIQTYPALDERVQVSAVLGREPVWAASGERLYYRSANGLERVDVIREPRLTVGVSETVTTVDTSPGPASRAGFDVSADESRIVGVRTTGDGALTGVRVVVDWTSVLADVGRVE